MEDSKVTPPHENSSQKKQVINFITGIGIGIVILFVIILLISNFGKKFQLNTTHDQSSVATQNTDSTNRILAKVGTENIYQHELHAEYADYPFAQSPKVTKLLLAKIAKDSIILQAGQAEGLVTLDANAFNSPNVDYGKRLQLVSKVQDTISQRVNSVSGSVISIWFDNVSPGSVGYDKGKQIAYTTIQTIYNLLKNKNISISQAAQFIENDAALAQVDPAYKSNALLQFSADTSDTITYVPAFDAMIRKLSPGQLTPIYLAKDTDKSKKTVDAVYMFAQVSSKKDNGQNENFNHWYAQKQKDYEITIY
jgi:hypothetical protein